MFKSLYRAWVRFRARAYIPRSPMDKIKNEMYGKQFPGESKYLVCGDSVVYAAKPFIDQLPDTFCTALGGNNTSELLRSLQTEILNFRPEKVLIHCGGNDLLGGRPLEEILDNLKKIARILQLHGVERIGFMEIVPLGKTPALEHMNFTVIPNFMKEVEKLGVFEIVPFRYMLADSEGWLRAEYNSGDHVHHVFPKTQLEAWLPAVAYWLFRS